MSDSRDELLRGIQDVLAGAKTPLVPQDPGPNATPWQKEDYARRVKDYEVEAILAKGADVTREERNRVHAEIMRVLRGEQ